MKIMDVAIIGAGPYGLSLAAHLTGRGVDHCLFGPPMAFWHDHMPPGMKLKSDGNSSDLPAPGEGFPVSRFQTAVHGRFSVTEPITIDDFRAYGMTFHDSMVSHADPRMVRMVERDGTTFALTLADGTECGARSVVVAVGVEPFASMPPILAALPRDRVTHSVAYGPVASLAGKRVAVVGSGASAIDVAASLHEAGSEVTIVTRRAGIAFHHPPGRRPLRQRLRRPDTGIGGGWDLWFYANAPSLFHMLPPALRLAIVDRTLGPAPGWFMRDRITGKVPILSGMTIARATAEPDGVAFDLHDPAGAARRLTFDHVVAATGFRPDVRRLDMLDTSLTAAIRTIGSAPLLSRRFETSVPGLYMIGPIAAASFGPVMRFVFGAGKTTPVLARHLAAQVGSPIAAPIDRRLALAQPGE